MHGRADYGPPFLFRGYYPSGLVDFETMQDGIWISRNYYDDIIAKLRQTKHTAARQHQLVYVLTSIIRHLKPNSFECELSALELSEVTEIDKAEIARCLIVLDSVGAIHRLKGTRPKVITVAPEHAFRGSDVAKAISQIAYEQAVRKSVYG